MNCKAKVLSVVISAALAATLLVSAAWGDQDLKAKETDRLQAAGQVMSDIMGAPDQGIPAEVLASADCVAVVPGMKKGGFVFGADYGRGVATCKTANGWSAPAPFMVGGGSWGLQIGGQEIDLVMLVMNKQGMQNLLNSKFRIGADASAAAGPVGRHAAASTDWKLRAQVLTYSRARGAFAGISLNGAEIKQDDSATQALYGRMIPFKEILGGQVPNPEASKPFVTAVEKYYAQARSQENPAAATAASNSENTGGVSGTAAATSSVQSSQSATSGSVGASTETPASAAGATPQTTPSQSTSGTEAGAQSSQSGITSAAVGTSSQDPNAIATDIQNAIKNEPNLSSSNVTVSANGSKILLSGMVPSQQDKATIKRIAQEHANGLEVVDNVVVSSGR